jgi:prepilin-type N-terminal cleavage/methylation domain-containing protein
MMSNHTASKREDGFTLIELIVVLAIMMILAAICPPLVMNTVSTVKLSYSATDFSGLAQKARIESTRKNTFYPIQQAVLPSGATVFFVDLNKNTTLDAREPLVEMASQVTVFSGVGNGAPNEAAFVVALNFAPDPAGSLPAFNARGLPCLVAVGGATCAQVAGQGFVYFLSRRSSFGTTWASVAVTPSGRVQVWTYNGNNWIQQ